MEKIWSPWRSQYIETFKDAPTKNECFICAAVNSKPAEASELLILERQENCIAIMNKFPYNSGHTLVAPLRHIANIEELEIDEMVSIMQMIQRIVAAMKESFNPHGFNIGVNIGLSAGAGLPQHVHFHIVPRWNGDANFTATVADYKIISQSIEDTRMQLLEVLRK
jgi:ATP adenylyltransferase